MTKEELIRLIAKKLEWKREKALSWYKTENPHLRGARPEELVNRGELDQVLELLDRRERERKENESE